MYCPMLPQVTVTLAKYKITKKKKKQSEKGSTSKIVHVDGCLIVALLVHQQQHILYSD